MIISGISGPATLGIAQMLTGCIYSEFTVNKLKSESEREFIRNWLNDIKNLDKWFDNKENSNICDAKNGLTYPIDYSILSENKLKRLNKLINDNGFGVCAIISIGIYHPEKTEFHDERKIVLWNFTDITDYGKQNPDILRN